MGPDGSSGFGERLQRVFEDPLANRRGAEDYSAVCDGFGDCGEFKRGVDYAGGVDGSFCGLERDGELVDDAKMAEAEVVHGAGRGTDIGWIACADENYDDAILMVGEHRFILGGARV